MNSLNYQHDYSTNSHQKVELYNIAHDMKKVGLSDEFIANAIDTALHYEGMADLLKLWRDEDDIKERDDIVADIQELIDDCAVANKEVFTEIKMNDLDAISTEIRAFKDSLLKEVNEKGGISYLAKATHIPQPSLSRFFNSNAMPRRSTLLKIASALNIDRVRINPLWVR